MKEFEHIVIFHPAAIGDSLLATPVAAKLKARFPRARITYWAHSGLQKLMESMCPSIDKFIEYEKKQSLLARAKLLGSLRADLFVDLSNSLKGRLIPLLVGVQSLHYRKQSLKSNEKDCSKIMHAVDNFLACINPVLSSASSTINDIDTKVGSNNGCSKFKSNYSNTGIESAMTHSNVSEPTAEVPAAREKIAIFPTIFPPGLTEIEHHSLEGQEKDSQPGATLGSLVKMLARIRDSSTSTNQFKLIAIVPGVGNLRPNRSYPIDKWVELISEISLMSECGMILIGGKDDASIAERIRNLSKKIAGERLLDLCGKLELHETALVLKECDIVVSGDTGPAHLAVAVGTPVIGLYGPTRLARSGPYGYEHLAIERTNQCPCLESKFCKEISRANRQSEANKQLDIDHGGSGYCMSTISTEDIIEKLKQVRYKSKSSEFA